MARRLVILAAALLVASLALVPLAASRSDPTVTTCGYHKGAEECESYCILGLWVSKDGGATHTEACVVPNCACYPIMLPRFSF